MMLSMTCLKFPPLIFLSAVFFQVPEVCVLQAAAMAAKLEGEVSARAEAKASCSKPDTLLVKEEELQESVKGSSERGFNEVLSMIERASSHQDDVLALSCLKEAQDQARTLLRLQGSL